MGSLVDTQAMYLALTPSSACASALLTWAQVPHTKALSSWCLDPFLHSEGLPGPLLQMPVGAWGPSLLY